MGLPALGFPTSGLSIPDRATIVTQMCDIGVQQERNNKEKVERRRDFPVTHLCTFVRDTRKSPHGIRSGFFKSLILLGSSKSAKVLDLIPRNIHCPAPTLTFRLTS